MTGMNMENSSSIRVTLRPMVKNDRQVILKVTQVRVVGSKEVTKGWQRVNILARALLPKFVDNFEAMMHNLMYKEVGGDAVGIKILSSGTRGMHKY
jgi:hypothetical protein